MDDDDPDEEDNEDEYETESKVSQCNTKHLTDSSSFVLKHLNISFPVFTMSVHSQTILYLYDLIIFSCLHTDQGLGSTSRWGSSYVLISL